MSCVICGEPWSSIDDMDEYEHERYRDGKGCPCCRKHRLYCPFGCGATFGVENTVLMGQSPRAWVQGIVGVEAPLCKCGARMVPR
jgi:hypothetical protein